MKMDIQNGRYWDQGVQLISGCTEVSGGCEHCWSRGMQGRFPATNHLVRDGRWTGRVKCHGERLDRILRAKKPRVWAVWNDLFHPVVPEHFIARVIWTMEQKPEHTFLVLTKRPQRMPEILKYHYPFPKNIWLGTSVENHAAADERIPWLLKCPGKRFVSIEPMLGPVDLTRIKWAEIPINRKYYESMGVPAPDNMWSTNNALISRPADAWNSGKAGIHQVILGGETGHGARPMHPDWPRKVRDDCENAGVPFFFKGWGEYYTNTLNMMSDERVFRMFNSYSHAAAKGATWINGGVCVDVDGRDCRIGKDFMDARYPVAVMHRVGRNRSGRKLDGRTHDELAWGEQ